MNKSPELKDNRFHFEDEIKQMDFGAAMNEVVNGKKVRRLDWEDKGVYLCMDNEQLMIFRTDDNKLHPLIVSAGDIIGTDWVVIIEEDKVIH